MMLANMVPHGATDAPMEPDELFQVVISLKRLGTRFCDISQRSNEYSRGRLSMPFKSRGFVGILDLLRDAQLVLI